MAAYSRVQAQHSRIGVYGFTDKQKWRSRGASVKTFLLMTGHIAPLLGAGTHYASGAVKTKPSFHVGTVAHND